MAKPKFPLPFIRLGRTDEEEEPWCGKDCGYFVAYFPTLDYLGEVYLYGDGVEPSRHDPMFDPFRSDLYEHEAFCDKAWKDGGLVEVADVAAL